MRGAANSGERASDFGETPAAVLATVEQRCVLERIARGGGDGESVWSLGQADESGGMCPEFLCGNPLPAGANAAASLARGGALERAGAFLLPSSPCLLCMGVGAAVGVLLGCAGAAAARPGAAAAQCTPLLVAGAALYAAAYLT